MAAGNAHVRAFEPHWQHDTDYDPPTSSPVDFAGVRIGFQYRLRHRAFERAIHKIFAHWYHFDLRRRSLDCNIRSTERAGAQLKPVAGVAETTQIHSLDGGDIIFDGFDDRICPPTQEILVTQALTEAPATFGKLSQPVLVSRRS